MPPKIKKKIKISEAVPVKEKTKMSGALLLATLSIILSFFAIIQTNQLSPKVKSASNIKMAAVGVTYYVDAVGGNDTNSGTGETSAWQTLTNVNNRTFSAGDSILFKRNGQWSGTLTPLGSGNAIAPITFDAYGTGNNPILTNTLIVNIITNWTKTIGSNIYTASTTKPIEMIFVNGQAGSPVGDVSALKVNNQFYYNWGNGTLSVYFDSAPTSSTLVEAYVYQNLINAQKNSYLIIRNLTLKNGSSGLQGLVSLADTSNIIIDGLSIYDSVGSAGIAITAYSGAASGNNIIKNCQIYNIKGSRVSKAFNPVLNGMGLSIAGPNNTNFTTGNQIINNVIHDNGTYNISLSASSNNIISGNTVYNGGWAGINISGGPENIISTVGASSTVEHNTVYGNCQVKDDCAGINAWRVGNGNIIRYNLVHDQHDTTKDGGILGTVGIRFDGAYCPDPNNCNSSAASTGNLADYNIVYNEYEGFQIYNFSNIELANNTVYNSNHAGLMLMSNKSTVYIKNTILKNNIFNGAKDYLIYNTYTQQSNFSNNIYYPDGPTKFYWQDVGANGVSSNFSGWLSHGQDSNSISSDPRFVASTTYNFQLQAGSPAIDKGVLLSLTPDYAGTQVPQGLATDIGALESSSVVCIPKTCAQLGKTCGSQADGCGGTLNCGTCASGSSCISGTCKKVCNSSTCSGYYSYWFRKYYYSCTTQGCCTTYPGGTKCKWKY